MMILHCRLVETVQHERNYARGKTFFKEISLWLILVIERLAVAFVFLYIFNSCTALNYSCVYLMRFALNMMRSFIDRPSSAGVCSRKVRRNCASAHEPPL